MKSEEEEEGNILLGVDGEPSLGPKEALDGLGIHRKQQNYIFVY